MSMQEYALPKQASAIAPPNVWVWHVRCDGKASILILPLWR